MKPTTLPYRSRSIVSARERAKVKSVNEKDWDTVAQIVINPAGTFQSLSIPSARILTIPDGCPCVAHIDQPDERMEKISAFESLSEEARYVIELVLNTPAEAADYICSPQTGRVNRTRIERYLRGVLRWKPRKVELIFGEVANYAGDLS